MRRHRADGTEGGWALTGIFGKPENIFQHILYVCRLSRRHWAGGTVKPLSGRENARIIGNNRRNHRIFMPPFKMASAWPMIPIGPAGPKIDNRRRVAARAQRGVI